MTAVELFRISDESFQAQPHDVTGLSPEAVGQLVVAFVRMDGRCVPLSFYRDNEWKLSGGTTNSPAAVRKLDFRRIPEQFRAAAKQIAWRYMRRGREGAKRPATSTLVNWLNSAASFFKYLDARGFKSLREVSPLLCIQYVEASKAEPAKRSGKPLALGTLKIMFVAVEVIHELSQWTNDPMPAAPWPDASAKRLAGVLTDSGPSYVGKTPLIPDDVFCTLLQAAWAMVQQGEHWLSLRDGLDRINTVCSHLCKNPVLAHKNQLLADSGWSGGLRAFNDQLLYLRTACYVVVASLSGCRNHELAYLQNDACYSTTDDDVNTYWWMRSRSDKTGEGKTEWMIPLAAVQAIRVLERWAKSYQDSVEVEIAHRQLTDPHDPEIAEALKHREALFLGESSRYQNQVRTIAVTTFNKDLKAFAAMLGLKWDLATHQFRRKFANYAARSRFGDLRYLKEHFKHWSMDMTLGYGLNESQDLHLYLEIEAELDDIKVGVVSDWLRDDTPLAGGFGKSIVEWRGTQPITLFKDHASMVRSIADSVSLRSALHGWCTADSGDCVGLGMDRLRCTDCDNAVIHQRHAHVYQRQYLELQALLDLNDIGDAGLNRVKSSMEKCRLVLEKLGLKPESEPTCELVEEAA
jgi:hypothetical protein